MMQGGETGGSHWLLPPLQAQDQGSRESWTAAQREVSGASGSGTVLPLGARNPQPGQLSYSSCCWKEKVNNNKVFVPCSLLLPLLTKKAGS